LEPGIPQVQLQNDLGLHPAEAKRATEDLVARGYIRLHRLVRKGRGAKPLVIEVLKSGQDELNKRGISPTPKLLKRGGFKHDVYARALVAGYRKKGLQHWIERTLGSKAFDLVYEDVDGKLIGIEIVLSGSASWNAEQALKAASVDGVARVVIACEERRLIRAIEAELAQRDALGLFKAKISCCPLGDLIDS
jgi:hypothetical protein